MKKLLGVVIAAVVVGGLVPALAQTLAAPRSARIQDELAASLGAASSDTEIVVLVHGTSRDAAVEAVADAGLEQLLVLESIGVPAAVGTAAEIRALAEDPSVTYIEPNTPIELFADTAHEATRTDEAHALTFDTDCETTTTGGKGKKRKGAVTTTTCTKVGPFDGAGRSIAIIDSGVDGTHPMFQRDDETSKVVRNLKVVCHDIVCPTGGGSDPAIVDVTGLGNDSDTPSAGGHGTHVASIAAGSRVETADGRPLAGTAPGADIVSLSVGQGLNILAADVALDWVARNHQHPCADPEAECNPITVVNNSYGPNGGGDFDPNSATAAITKKLIAAGVVMVWANGNGDTTDLENRGGDGSTNRSNPEGQNPLPGVLSVANYDDGDTGTRDGTLDTTSSRGLAVDSVTWPDLSAPGANITAACRPQLLVCSSGESDPNFGTIGGTSMAAPHVAGIVALLQQAKPGITPAAIEDALEDTAHRFTAGAEYGVDPGNTTTPSSFDKGHGLVDAVRSLDLVLSDTVESSAGPCSNLTGVDGTGEPQPYAVTLLHGPYDGSLDLTSVALSGSPTEETVTLTLGVAELTELPPSAGDGIYAEARFLVGASPHVIVVRRDARGARGTVDDNATDVVATFDVPSSTITLTAPRKNFTPAFGGPTYVTGVGVQLGRTVGAAVLWSDNAAAGCGTLDAGGTPPPPPPPDPDPSSCEVGDAEGCITTALAHEWEGDPAVDAYVASDCATPDNPVCDTERINVVVPSAGAKLRVVLATDDPAADDFDLYVYGPDGTEVGSKGSARGDEVLEIAVTKSGVYTVAVSAFLAPGSTFTGHASLVQLAPTSDQPA